MLLQRWPKIEILSIEPHEIKFILSDTDTSVANAIRRIMIAEVPTLAIDLVEFYENTTVLNDEYIAHRLGLVPIRYCAPDSNRAGECEGAFLQHRQCVCYNYCPRCSVTFDLDVHFDKIVNENSELDKDLPFTVTSQQLKADSEFVRPAHFLNDEEANESHDKGISIVKIGPGQHLKLKAIARLGISKEHAKWCPVAVATYRFDPIIHINEEACATLTHEQKQQLVDVCPDKILELDEISGKLTVARDAWEAATYTEDLKVTQTMMKKRPEDDDFVTVDHSEDRFIFSVEGTGAMDAEEILMSSLKVLKARLSSLIVSVENMKEPEY